MEKHVNTTKRQFDNLSQNASTNTLAGLDESKEACYSKRMWFSKLRARIFKNKNIKEKHYENQDSNRFRIKYDLFRRRSV